MLVLSRMKDEVIHIGDEVTMTIVDVRGDKVKIGFEAPPEIRIHRSEVYHAIKEESETVREGSDSPSDVPPHDREGSTAEIEAANAKD